MVNWLLAEVQTEHQSERAGGRRDSRHSTSLVGRGGGSWMGNSPVNSSCGQGSEVKLVCGPSEGHSNSAATTRCLQHSDSDGIGVDALQLRSGTESHPARVVQMVSCFFFQEPLLLAAKWLCCGIKKTAILFHIVRDFQIRVKVENNNSEFNISDF